jgi:methylase of polypeptide subunit release factors
MRQISLPLVMGLLVSFGCRTIPGQDVRYEPTPMPVVRAMLELADAGPQDVVYDLGSGDGRIPITAAKEFGARGVGIEIDPSLVRQAQAKARECRGQSGVQARRHVCRRRAAGYRRDSLPAPETEPETTAEAALRAAARFAGRFLRLGHG